MKIETVVQQGPIGGANAHAPNRTGAAPVAPAVAAPAAAAPAKALAEPTTAELKASVEVINKAIQSLTNGLEFSIDDSTKKNVVKVVDSKTKEVLRQFPSQEVLDIAKALDKLQGVLLKDQA